MTRADITTLAGMAQGTPNWDDPMRGAMTTLDVAVGDRMIVAADYGWATGATAATNSTAIAAAIADARPAGLPVFLGSGTFQVSTTINAAATISDGTAVSIVGMGTETTFIVCTDNTAPLMFHGGFHGTVHGFRIQHVGDNPDGTFGDGLVFRKSAYNRYSDLQIDNCRRSFAVEQASIADPGEGGGGDGNWFFSNYTENIFINRYSESGLYLRAVTGRSTGNVMNNTYVQNKAPDGSRRAATGFPVDLFLVEDGVFNQLNIEDHAGFATGLLHNAGGAVTINGLHFERVTLDGFQSKFAQAYGDSYLIINGLNIAFCDVAGTNSGGWSAFAQVDEGGRVEVNGTSLNNLTRTRAVVDVPLYRVASQPNGGSIEYTYEVELLHATTPVTLDGDAPTTTAPGLKRVGDNLYNTAAVTSTSIDKIVSLTQAAYDALTPDPATLYVITG